MFKIFLNLISIIGNLSRRESDAIVAALEAAFKAGGKDAPTFTLEGVINIVEFLNGGGKIAAIKEYRSLTGLALKEAKTDVERIAACMTPYGVRYDARGIRKTGYD